MKISDYIHTVEGLGDIYRETDGLLIMYPTMGLAGEVGELLDKLHEDTDSAEIVKEMGDVLWYTMSLCIDADIEFGWCNQTFTEFAKTTWGTETCQTVTEEEISEAMRRLPIIVGGVCEIVKKTFRDNEGVLLANKRLELTGLLGVILRYLYVIGAYESVTLDVVAEANIGKLTSRRDRGVLHGDGDNR